MGLVYAEIEITSYEDIILVRNGYLKEDKIRKITVNMMVDSGSVMMAINETIRTQMGFRLIGKKIFTLANGQETEMDIVGGIEVNFKNRSCETQAVVLPGDTEPLFGAIPMEAMDLVIIPSTNSLDVNPKHPYVASHAMKGYR
jgi:hypothetical protein